MARACASGAVDSGLIPSQVKPMILTLVFTASLLDAKHWKDNEKNKLAGLRVAPLGKAFSEVFSSWCGRQMAGNS